ncbi:tetratricopeptide repeat-containing sensor histidine kinase [Marinoscillum pacificum]|uniref:tetratricopeptide repeat-containing sensor histidine kinase n=1 Tax=Marinoscillum pacificum TaxID=392723 RepID=UPI0021581D84|nr:ATP-binding protein [Marinoscillum pacificum]
MASYKFSIFLLIFSFISIDISAQNQLKADSIKQVIEQGILSPSQELEAYYWLSTFASDAYEKLEYGEKLLVLAEKANSLEYRIKANCKIGIAHRFMGNLSRALEYLFKSAEEAEGKEQFRDLLAEDIYGEISTCYTQNGDSENALYYGVKTVNILRKSNRRQYFALSLINIGYDHYLIGNYDSAMTYYDESETILRKIDMQIGIAYVIGNRALIYWKKGDRDLAKKGLFEAIEMLQPIGDDYGMADYYNHLGKIFLEEKQEDEAFTYTLKGLELAKNAGLKEQARDASQILYRLSLKKNNLEDAIQYQTQYYAYKDSIQNLQTTQRLGDLRTEYEVGLKQKEVDYLVEQQKNTRIVIVTGALLLAAFVFLIIIVFTSFRSKNRLSKQLEKQNDDLEQLNHTKDKYFSIISHDLREPVHTLGGLITVCQMYLKDGDPKKITGIVEQMGGSVQRLIMLLDNLLNWAMNQRGQFPYVPEKLDLNEIVNRIVDMYKDNAVAKDVKLKYTHSEEQIFLFGDKNTISTIIRNLVHNGIKYTHMGGSVNISATQSNGYCQIEVSDTGVGISQERLSNLFNPEELNTSVGTIGETGLGLGLQLVNDFTHKNKGNLTVTSKLNEGTKFIVELPLAGK